MGVWLRGRRLSRLATIGLLAMGLVWTTSIPTQAASLTFGFTGTVSAVTSGLGGTFNTGQTLTGTYTFDSLTPDLDPDPTRGQYALTASSVTLGGYTATGIAGNIIVIDNLPGIGPDSLSIVLSPMSGAAIGSFSPELFTFGLGEPTGIPFSSDALPLTPCVACVSFSSNSYVWLFGSQRTESVSGRITALTVVPEPSTWLMFGTGLVGLLGYVWRRRTHG